MASNNRHNARKAAVQALYQWDITQQHADEIEMQFAQIHSMQNLDRRYFNSILSELPKHVDELKALIEPYIDREFDSMDPVEKAILRLGAFELKCRQDVPTKVVVNEMIEVAKVFGSQHSYKFVNGVMDKLAKQLRAV